MKKGWTEYTYRCRFYKDISGFFCELPKIPVELGLNGKVFPTDAVIDSGCTRTHIRADIADILGIDTSKLRKTKTTGITGSRDGWLCKVTLYVVNQGEPFDIEALIFDELPVAVLLGTNDFFIRFDVLFERSKQRF